MRRINTKFATMIRWITSIENSLHVIGEDDTDSLEVTVYPSSLESTATQIDTGDGTGWIKISSGSTGQGNFTLEVIAFDTNSSSVSCVVRISDDAGIAPDFDITVTRGVDPV